MFSNVLLLIFALSFMGCVLATPFVVKLATWLGAIDRPDQFRRVHKGATPRMGGLGLAFGLLVSGLVAALGGYLSEYQDFQDIGKQAGIVIAALITLAIGVIDDRRGLRPRPKLLGQSLAVVALYLGGVRISQIAVLGVTIPLSHPGMTLYPFGYPLEVSLPGFLVTLVWFLGCMNVWNLIDGMDGLASGVGLLVSGTLMLVAVHQNTIASAALAAALAGSLAGFLLYNWHPACIFLGDTGSLLIGLLIGVIGVQGSLKGTSAVSILFPILAMGLPISDTAMAIFRRWVRNLPLSAADRRHVHHLVLGLGLNPRQAAVLLYSFSAFLCGAVLLGVAVNSEFLALVLGGSGCLAFLLILTSRRDELKTLRDDLKARMSRKRQERHAAKLTWEAIQRIELCADVEGIWPILQSVAAQLGCDRLRFTCRRDGEMVFDRASAPNIGPEFAALPEEMAGPTVSFRLRSREDLLVGVTIHQALDSELAADIAFRFVQRLSLACSERMERLFGKEASVLTETPPPGVGPTDAIEPAVAKTESNPIYSMAGSEAGPGPWANWLKSSLGWPTSSVARSQPSLGKK